MKNQQIIITCLFILIGFKSFACSCPVFKNLERLQLSEFERSECIFIGEVLEINAENNTYKIKVLDSLKGTENGQVYEGTYDTQCGPTIYELGKWIFYGRTDSNGILKVNECGLTRTFKNPSHDFLDFNQTKSKLAKIAQMDLLLEIKKVRNRME